MDKATLEKVLSDSSLYHESGGEEGSIANLREADLSAANLSDANLRWANLSEANLSAANLNGANLREADLSAANLSDADLRWANLREADLSAANLSDANLRWANLSEADLRYADLRYADLRGANLSEANLRDANLRDAKLSGASLSGAIGLAPVTEESIALLLKFADQVTSNPATLFMNEVHLRCGTAHCGAGWICTLSPIAATLEKLLGWNAAACICCPIPEFTSLFYANDAEMLAFAQSVVEDRGASLRQKYGLSSQAVGSNIDL